MCVCVSECVCVCMCVCVRGLMDCCDIGSTHITHCVDCCMEVFMCNIKFILSLIFNCGQNW